VKESFALFFLYNLVVAEVPRFRASTTHPSFDSEIIYERVDPEKYKEKSYHIRDEIRIHDDDYAEEYGKK
jgi:hypothetical protein